MGNRRAREFGIRRQDEADWQQARTQERSATADVSAQGIGHRRVQVIRSPSFEQGTCWEVRQLGETWRVYRSEVVARTGRDATVVGYEPVRVEPSAVGAICDRLTELVVPLLPANGRAGCDGTSYELAVFDLFCGWRLFWWEEPPPQRATAGEIANELIALFEAAGGETPLIGGQS